jgi:hypothetical protein
MPLLCNDMKQAGCIVWTEDMNKRVWIEQARAEGYKVREEGNIATLWLPDSKRGKEIG